MTWSASAVGTPEAVRAYIHDQLEGQAKSYEGNAERQADGDPGKAQNLAEAADIRAALSSVLAAVDSFKPTAYANAIDVKTSGSRNAGGCSVTIAVQGAKLCL